MLGLALDPTIVERRKQAHDLYLDEDNNLAMVRDTQAVGQLAQQRLLTYRGEWFLDTEVGVPWFQEVFVRPFNEAVSEALIKDAILDTPGVREIWSFQFDVHYAQRHVDVPRCELLTVFNEVVEI